MFLESELPMILPCQNTRQGASWQQQQITNKQNPCREPWSDSGRKSEPVASRIFQTAAGRHAVNSDLQGLLFLRITSECAGSYWCLS